MSRATDLRTFEVTVYLIERQVAFVIVNASNAAAARRLALQQPVECLWPCETRRELGRVEELTAFATAAEGALHE